MKKPKEVLLSRQKNRQLLYGNKGGNSRKIAAPAGKACLVLKGKKAKDNQRYALERESLGDRKRLVRGEGKEEERKSPSFPPFSRCRRKKKKVTRVGG